jgi:hypothetical protein
MIKGRVESFAIESVVTEVFSRDSLMALGSFVVHVAGKRYGVAAPDATMLACSFGSVEKRISMRGAHVCDFSQIDGIEIAAAYLALFYGVGHGASVSSEVNLKRFGHQLHSGGLIMAPDGDSAFDDESHILQFDMGAHVRLVAFKNEPNLDRLRNSLSDVLLTEEWFYSVLEDWRGAFWKEWQAALARSGAA